MITYHHNKYNNKENIWNIVRITKMGHRNTKWANTDANIEPLDLLNARLPETFNRKKMQYLWSTIKPNANLKKMRYACTIKVYNCECFFCCLRCIHISYDSGVSFSSTWKPYLWNVIIRNNRAFVSQFLWQDRILTSIIVS